METSWDLLLSRLHPKIERQTHKEKKKMIWRTESQLKARFTLICKIKPKVTRHLLDFAIPENDNEHERKRKPENMPGYCQRIE